MKKINKVLISVFNKSSLSDILGTLKKHQIEIISTGGTKKFIEDNDINVTSVEDNTDTKAQTEVHFALRPLINQTELSR